MRIALALVTCLVGCDGGSSRSCIFEDVLARDVPAAATPCGALAVQATDAERTAARDCVLAELGGDREFVVSFGILGIDSRIARAYYAVADGGTLGFRAVFYDGDPGGGGGERRPTATTSTCSALATVSPCSTDEMKVSLCLSCVQAAPLETCATSER